MPHLKRSGMPDFWSLERKKKRFAFVPLPGPHPKKDCVPLIIIIRDNFKLCETAKEAKKIIKNREILVDGREITEEKFPIGLMDILTIKKIKKNYLVLPSKKGFEFKEINEKEAETKYCRIIGKRMLKKGLQLNLHDGKNLLVPKEQKDKYMVSDTLKISLEKKKPSSKGNGASSSKKTNVEEILPYKKGADVLIVKGRNRGVKGILKEIIIKKDLEGQKAEVEINKENKIFKRDLIFVAPKEF